MAKKITGVQSTFVNNEDKEATEGGLNVTEPTLTNSAFSIVYTGKKKYDIVRINFAGGSTNSAGPVEVIAKDLDLYEAQHEFKKQTIMAGLFDQGIDKTE